MLRLLPVLLLFLMAIAENFVHADEQPPLSPEDRFGLAAGHYQRAEYDAAIEGFRSLITSHPNSRFAASAYFHLGESLVHQQDYQSAYPTYQLFVRQFPNDPRSIRARFRMAECAYHQEWLTQAASQLERFIQNHPQHPLGEYALGLLAETRLKRNEPQLARQVFQQALAQFPNSPQSDRNRFGLARALQSLGETEQASRFYRMLTIDPANGLYGRATMQLGIIDFAEQRFEQAREKLQNAVASPLTPETRATAKYWLARTLIAMDEHQLALEELEDVIESPIAAELKSSVLFDAAVAASHAGQLETASDWLAQLRTTWPASKRADDALQLQIETLFRRELYDSALPLITEYKSDFNDHPRLPLIREIEGRIFYQQQKFAAAARIFASLIEEYSHAESSADRIDAWRYLLGLAHIGNRDYHDGNDELTRINLDDADSAFRDSVLLARSTAAIGLGKPERAMEWLEQYLESEPTGSAADRARSELAIALAQTGQWDQAKDLLRQLRTLHEDRDLYLETKLLLAEYALLDRQFNYAEQLFESLADPALPRRFVVRGISGMAWTRTTRGDDTSAVAEFEKLIREFPETPFAAESAMACGKYFEQQDQFARAVEMYQLIQDRFADSGFAAFARLRQAFGLVKLGGTDNLKKSEQLLDRYLEDPQGELRDEAIYQLAWVYRDTDRPELAIKQFERLVSDYPNSRFWADAAYRVAQQQFSTGNNDRVSELIDKLLDGDIDPVIEVRAIFLKGQLLVRQQRWEESEGLMESVLGLTDEEQLRRRARYWLAESQFQLGHYTDAFNQLQTLIDNPGMVADDRLAWVHLRRAQCCAYVERWTAALDYALADRKQFSEFEAAHEFDFVIGRAHAAQGRMSDARLAFEQVINSPTGKTTKTAAMAQWRIGETWFHLEDYRAALQAFYKVDSLYAYPHWQAAALVEAGKCHEHLGNWKLASNLYQQLIDRFPESEFQVVAQQRLAMATRQAKQIETDTNTSR